jgi:hypothetical protein
MPARDHPRLALTAALLALAAVPRIWAAVWDQGIFWPDEIFQSIEQAHRFAFGYGFVSWEFQVGARSWLFPGVLGLLWKLLAWLGVSAAPTLVISAKLGMAAWSLAGVYAAMRLAARLGGSEAAVLCGVLGALFPPSIVYGSRCMTEMASGPLFVIAALLALDTQRWKLIAAGCLAGLAVFLRYQNGVVTVALLGWLFAQRRRDDALYYAAGAALTGLAGGLLDLFIWGTPFHSFLTYVRFHLQVSSAVLGVEPFLYYIEVLWSAVGVSLVAVAIGLWECRGRALGLLVVVLVYVLAHSLVAHKELRYMMPIAPLLLALSGVGLASFIGRFLSTPKSSRTAPSKQARRARKRRSGDAADNGDDRDPAQPRVRTPIWVTAGVLAAVMSWKTAHASFDDFGQRFGPLSGSQPLWHTMEGVNRLLWSAGAQPDLCGLLMIGYGPIWTGGYTYLHRDVPILSPPVEGLDEARFAAISASTNYLLLPAEIALPAPYTTVETIGKTKLARRSGTCAPPPASYTRLFPQ